MDSERRLEGRKDWGMNMEKKIRTIWKFELDGDGEQIIRLPPDSKVLTVQVQREAVCLWALVDPVNAQRVTHHVWVHGTGHPVVDAADGRYIGSVQLSDGALVFHVFVGGGA